jgi:hypothetical protein
MGQIASALCCCIYRSELEELRRDMDRLEREVGLSPWCCYKRNAYYKCSNTSWI